MILTEDSYRIRVRKGDTEFEVQGDQDFVEAKYKELSSLLSGPESPGPGGSQGQTTPASSSAGGAPKPSHGVPTTWSAKLKNLMDEGFFTDPKQPAQVTAEFRTRVWGVYKTKDVSSQLIYYSPKIGLRRISLGEDKVGYVYP